MPCMRKAVLYLIEAVFLLAFWTYMFRYVKPGFFATVALFVALAAIFAVLEKFLTGKK